VDERAPWGEPAGVEPGDEYTPAEPETIPREATDEPDRL